MDELQRIEKAIQEAERLLASTEGAIGVILTTLKDEYGYDSIEEAEKGLAKLEDENRKMEEVLTKRIERLNALYAKAKQNG